MKKPLRIVLMWGALVSGCAGPNTVIDSGTRIHHDDFEYSVQQVDRTDRIGDKQAGGTFYVVTFGSRTGPGASTTAGPTTSHTSSMSAAPQYEDDRAAQKALEAVNPGEALLSQGGLTGPPLLPAPGPDPRPE